MALLKITKEQKTFINLSFVICMTGLALSLLVVKILLG